MTIELRKGVEWADGEPFTCDDVKFTFEAFDTTEGGSHKTFFNQWMESVECVDDFTVLVNFNNPTSRFHQRIMVGHENHVVILPEHIWSQVEDLATFKNFDLAQGGPMGSGPYKAVLVTAQQIVWDRRDDWWGAKIGFMDLPAPERIIATTSATDESTTQMYMANKMDYGAPVQIGSFEAGREKNPNLRTWHREGPKYGAPDGCNYVAVLNNATKFAETNVRVAVNHAIDRQQLVELGYQNATHPNMSPLSSYILPTWGPILQEVFDKWERDVPKPDMVEDLMIEAGYEKNGDGFWAKDGEVLHINIATPQWLAPIGPVISEQLIKAGFSNEEKLDTSGQFSTRLQMAEYDMNIHVHCGSLYDPWDTLQEFHSKHTVPLGEPAPRMPFSAHRYAGDPAMDEALDYMESHVPSATDPEYVAMAKQAMDIYLRDMPTIILAEELHVIPMNETFWTGWPTADDPYIAPYPCWQDFTLAVFHLQPTQ
jgi:peptide/nickel transport system substrate-binding protein